MKGWGAPMTSVEFCRPTLDDVPALLEFELKNRHYFEQFIPPRAASFYQPDNVRLHVTEAMQQQALGIAHQFLIKSEQQIIGRVNLTGVQRAYYCKGTVGYRIGEQYAAQGIATQAVKFLCEEGLLRQDLWRLEAQVRADHVASIRVLEKNHFVQYGRSRQSLYWQGRWVDLLYFERHRDSGFA